MLTTSDKLIHPNHPVLTLLKESKFDFLVRVFHIFGSVHRTDYDLYTKDTEEVRNFLLANGFKKVENIKLGGGREYL